MTLETLKEDYKKTFSEPRLSGKYLPEDFQKILFDKIDAASTLDEFVSAVDSISGNNFHNPEGNTERHILLRILAWENEPPIKPKFKTIEIHNIYADQWSIDINEFINKVVRNADYHDFFYIEGGLPDKGVDDIDYYKVGDKIYEVSLHCEAEWVGDWSVRENLPGEVSLVSVLEITDFEILKDEGNYILIQIPN